LQLVPSFPPAAYNWGASMGSAAHSVAISDTIFEAISAVIVAATSIAPCRVIATAAVAIRVVVVVVVVVVAGLLEVPQLGEHGLARAVQRLRQRPVEGATQERAPPTPATSATSAGAAASTTTAVTTAAAAAATAHDKDGRAVRQTAPYEGLEEVQLGRVAGAQREPAHGPS